MIRIADAALLEFLALAYRRARHGEKRQAYKRLQDEVHAQLRRAATQ